VIAELHGWQSRLGPLPKGPEIPDSDPRKIVQAAAMVSGAATSQAASTPRARDIVQFWQNLQARLQPAVPNESTAVPG